MRQLILTPNAREIGKLKVCILLSEHFKQLNDKTGNN